MQRESNKTWRLDGAWKSGSEGKQGHLSALGRLTTCSCLCRSRICGRRGVCQTQPRKCNCAPVRKLDLAFFCAAGSSSRQLSLKYDAHASRGCLLACVAFDGLCFRHQQWRGSDPRDGVCLAAPTRAKCHNFPLNSPPQVQHME